MVFFGTNKVLMCSGLRRRAIFPPRAPHRTDAQHDEVIRGARSPSSEAKDPTFQSFLDEEFIAVRRSAWNNATREKVSYYFNLMCSEFGASLLTDIDMNRLQRFLNDMQVRRF